MKNFKGPVEKWNKAKEKVKQTEKVKYTEINNVLNGFRDYIEKLLKNDFEYKIKINHEWLRNEYEEYLNIFF